MCDITVLLMCAVTVWQQVSRMESGDNPKDTDDTVDSFWNFVELAFTALFALEVVRVTWSARYVLTSWMQMHRVHTPPKSGFNKHTEYPADARSFLFPPACTS